MYNVSLDIHCYISVLLHFFIIYSFLDFWKKLCTISLSFSTNLTWCGHGWLDYWRPESGASVDQVVRCSLLPVGPVQGLECMAQQLQRGPGSQEQAGEREARWLCLAVRGEIHVFKSQNVEGNTADSCLSQFFHKILKRYLIFNFTLKKLSIWTEFL